MNYTPVTNASYSCYVVAVVTGIVRQRWNWSNFIRL